MPENNTGATAGSISLDLVVKDKLTEQITKITTNAGAVAARTLSESMDKAVDAATEAISKKMTDLASMIRDKLGALEFPEESAQKFTAQLDTLTEKLSLVQKTWQELSAVDPLSTASAKVAELEKRVVQLEKKLVSVGKKGTPATGATAKVPTPQATSSSGLSFSDITSGLSGGAGGIAGLIGTAVSGNPAVGAAVSSVTSTVLGTVSKSFKTVSSLINKLTGNATAKLKSIVVNLVDVTKPIQKIGSMLKRAFKSVFLASTIYAAFRALKDGLIEAANADEQFTQSLANVKENLAIAFTPIIQYIMPMLNTLMSGLERTSKQVATFMANLFGMSYKQAADARKKLQDTAAAAKKAKAAIAGIDELNILNDGNEGDSSKGSNITDFSDAKLPKWAEILKDAIRQGDWHGVGHILAQKVNETLDSVKWDSIEAKVKEKVTNLADLINGFVHGINPNEIGEALAGVINTITTAITTFADNIEWITIGQKITRGLNKAIKKIDWKKLGRALTAGIRILTDVLFGISTDFDWEEFGNGLSEGLNSAVDSIDTAKLGTAISNIIKGALTTASTFLSNTDFEKIGKKIADFFANLDVAGILSNLTQTITTLWTGIVNLISAFLDNTDFFKLGEDIYTGLTEGLGKSAAEGNTLTASGGLDKIALKLFTAFLECLGGIISSSAKTIKDLVVQPFLDKVSDAFGIKGNGNSSEGKSIGKKIVNGVIDGAGDKLEKAKEKFEELRDKIEDVFEDIGDWFKDRFDEARKNVESLWSSIGTWFSDRRTDIEEHFLGIGSWFKDRFGEARTNIEKKFEDIGGWFEKRRKDVEEHFKDVGAWFGARFQAARENIEEKFNTLKTWFEGIRTNIEDVWRDIPDFFKEIWEDVRDNTKEVLNDTLGIIEDFVNDGASGMGDFASQLAGDIAGKIFSKTIGSHIHIPRLATGGLAKAPTLAMIGDNPNARRDPEVVAPLSKLEGLMGADNTEVVELLRLIVELLRSGISAELIGSMFGNDFKRTVLRIVADDNARRG